VLFFAKYFCICYACIHTEVKLFNCFSNWGNLLINEFAYYNKLVYQIRIRYILFVIIKIFASKHHIYCAILCWSEATFTASEVSYTQSFQGLCPWTPLGGLQRPLKCLWNLPARSVKKNIWIFNSAILFSVSAPENILVGNTIEEQIQYKINLTWRGWDS